MRPGLQAQDWRAADSDARLNQARPARRRGSAEMAAPWSTQRSPVDLAAGHAGQRIYVVPEFDLVVIATAGLYDSSL
jgi:hypothetical protein